MAVLTSTAGLVATIDATGLAALTLNGTSVLVGGLSAENSSTRFGVTGETALGAVTTSSVLASNASAAIVRHVHANGVAQYVYTLDGEDLLIRATVTNRTGAPITALGFIGLTSQWSPRGAEVFGEQVMGAQTLSFPSSGLGVFHPSFQIPIGAWCATETVSAVTFGMAMYPIRTGLVRTLVINGDGAGGLLGPSFFISPVHPIAPNQTYAVSFGLRVSTNTDWRHLLDPYRTQFRATFGPVQYTADDRPVVGNFLDDVSAIGVGNPYGFKVGNHFDNAGHVATWISTFIPLMTAAGCQGVIFWNPYGSDPRGLEYSPDMWLVPPEVSPQIDTLYTALTAASLKMGRLAQPMWIGAHHHWNNPATFPGLYIFTDGFFTIEATNPTQLAWVLDRFAQAAPGGATLATTQGAAQGFTMYYLDSTITTLNELLIMKALREQWGPTVPSYTEQLTDIGMVYSGLYTEVSGPDDGPYVMGAVTQLGTTPTPLVHQICRWLTPTTSVLAQHKSQGAWSNTWLDYLYQHHLTPMPQEWQLGIAGLQARFAAHNATYLVSNKWVYDWETSP